VLYRAGDGYYAVTTDAAGAATLTSLVATVGVAAGALTAGGPTDLVAIDASSNQMSVLDGLGSGRFGNPITLPTASPARAIQIADLDGNGIPDAIVLSASAVSVYRGDGKGGFLPNPFTISAGSDPTGMTVANVNHDGKPDLLVGNTFGDLLVLLGNGDGTFQPGHKADQSVALAVLPNGSSTPDFIYADQGLDRVVVDYSGGQTSIVGDHSSGLLAPGAVQLADLNGDGIADLILANSGSNNVLVYPGLSNGQFGPELNGGDGFFTGTDPVGITVANLNGRPDLVIANKGSDDVSILLNEPTASGGFTFVPGPRLRAGPGPTSTVVQDVTGDGIPDLVVTDSGSNQVRIIPGVGGGFFNDQTARGLAVGSDPGQILVGTFTPGQGPQILTVNQGSNDVTLISNPGGNAPVFQRFPTGGIDPVAAFAVDLSGQGLESVVIANSGDGLFTLLGGGDCLEVEASFSNPEFPQPSALALAGVNGDEVDFYATTAGVEAAFALEFILPGSSASISPISGEVATEGATPLLLLPGTTSTSPIPGGSAAEAPAQLLPLTETALPLVGTLLPVVLNTRSNLGLSNASAPENQAEPTIALLPGVVPPTGHGQSSPVAASEATIAVSSPSSTPSSADQSLLNPGIKPEERSMGEGEDNGKDAPIVNAVP
jgi:hypothetical protein